MYVVYIIDSDSERMKSNRPKAMIL